jgi:hypothetical protein
MSPAKGRNPPHPEAEKTGATASAVSLLLQGNEVDENKSSSCRLRQTQVPVTLFDGSIAVEMQVWFDRPSPR